MNFSKALEEVKRGNKACREGWNGKGIFIELRQRPYVIEEGDRLWTSHSFIHMKTEDGYYVPWTAGQTDLLAEDWEVV